MKKIMVKKIIVFFVTIFIASNAYSFDNEITHRDITQKAVENSNLNDYLITNLELKSGVETTVIGRSILRWLREGSYLEDSPLCRASNHFHNPLKPWDQSYMSDEPWFIYTYCGATGYGTKYSNITWGTGYLSQAPYGSKTNSRNEMNWDYARQYYYLALTSASTTERETYFAKTFQALGQVIHLIEDMAVPAHTRNDFRAHLYFQGGSVRNPLSWFGNPFEWYVKQNPCLVTISSSTPIDITNATITRFWDTNRYDGSTRLNDSGLGLAEYTNANFFSESTIFAESKNPQDIHYFPHPAKGETNAYLIEQQAEDGITDKVYYVTINGENYRLVAYSYFYSWVDLLPDPSWAYNLDDAVYYDYARRLLPRATGYSAGLINYFFRGELDFEIRAGIQGGQSEIKITNNSQEGLEGAFSLYYEDASNNRYNIASWSSIILGSGQSSQSLAFTTPSEAKRYILVFHGRLGHEEGAVIGKVKEIPAGLGVEALSIRFITDENGNSYLEVFLSSLQDNYALKLSRFFPIEALRTYDLSVWEARFSDNDTNGFFLRIYDWRRSKEFFAIFKINRPEKSSQVPAVGETLVTVDTTGGRTVWPVIDVSLVAQVDTLPRQGVSLFEQTFEINFKRKYRWVIFKGAVGAINVGGDLQQRTYQEYLGHEEGELPEFNHTWRKTVNVDISSADYWTIKYYLVKQGEEYRIKALISADILKNVDFSDQSPAQVPIKKAVADPPIDPGGGYPLVYPSHLGDGYEAVYPWWRSLAYFPQLTKITHLIVMDVASRTVEFTTVPKDFKIAQDEAEDMVEFFIYTHYFVYSPKSFDVWQVAGEYSIWSTPYHNAIITNDGLSLTTLNYRFVRAPNNLIVFPESFDVPEITYSGPSYTPFSGAINVRFAGGWGPYRPTYSDPFAVNLQWDQGYYSMNITDIEPYQVNRYSLSLRHLPANGPDVRLILNGGKKKNLYSISTKRLVTWFIEGTTKLDTLKLANGRYIVYRTNNQKFHIYDIKKGASQELLNGNVIDNLNIVALNPDWFYSFGTSPQSDKSLFWHFYVFDEREGKLVPSPEPSPPATTSFISQGSNSYDWQSVTFRGE